MISGWAHAQSILYGGEGINTNSSGAGHACSGAFTVNRTAIGGNADRTPDKFLVTAGHCVWNLGRAWYDMDIGWSTSPNYIGNAYFTQDTFSNGVNVDIGLIELNDDGSHGAQPAVVYDTDYDRTNAINSPLGLGGERIIMTGMIDKDDLFVGMEICTTGASTGTNCGDITCIVPNQWVFADTCIMGGDSGGAVFTVDRDARGNLIGTGKAVGVVFGGTGSRSGACDNRAGNALVAFMPISRLAEVTGDEFELLTSKVHITKRNAPGFALDGKGGAANGQNIHLWSANEACANQQWVEIDRGNGYYSYQKQGTTHCIDGGGGGSRRQNVYLWACSATNHNQHWQKVNHGGNSYRLVKRNSPGFVINGGNGGNRGQNVNLWHAASSSQNLDWIITPVD